MLRELKKVYRDDSDKRSNVTNELRKLFGDYVDMIEVKNTAG